MLARLLLAVASLTILLSAGGQALAKRCPFAKGYTSYGSTAFSASGVEGRYFERDGMRIEVAANRGHVWISNETFTNAWICVGFNFPKTTARVAMGLAYWAVDDQNYHVVLVSPNGSVAWYQIVNNVPQITQETDIAAVPDPHGNGQGVDLEAILTGNRLQIIVNDVRVKTIEETPPQAPWRAGLFALDAGNEGYMALFPSVEIVELK